MYILGPASSIFSANSSYDTKSQEPETFLNESSLNLSNNDPLEKCHAGILTQQRGNSALEDYTLPSIYDRNNQDSVNNNSMPMKKLETARINRNDLSNHVPIIEDQHDINTVDSLQTSSLMQVFIYLLYTYFNILFPFKSNKKKSKFNKKNIFSF